MKLKFSIHYDTVWGECLHVLIGYYSQDGTVRRQNLSMQTDDGRLWTLETAALVSRHHPLSHIEYHYQVERAEQPDGHGGADGTVVRREWTLVPRRYSFDASKDYTFPDEWRDRPLAYHLYSDAYLTTIHATRGETVEAARLPLFRRTVVFRVSAPQLLPGQSVAVCGSHPAIGAWNTSRYLPMQYVGHGEWMLSVDAMGWLLPVEYKYVVTDTESHALVAWEEGDNRVVSGDMGDGQVLVLYGQPLRLCEQPWRLAGVSVPVFSLRSEHSYGVGDFGDLRRLVDWAVATGMKAIQLLPVNDTTASHQWGDSCPYNVVSFFALHPHYLDLEAAGTLRSRQQMTQYLRRRQELNALPYSDYEAVDRVKSEYLHELFLEQGKSVLQSRECRQWVAQNDDWLANYADYRQEPVDYVGYEQFLLHSQLHEAADYARRQGVALMGDLPIGLRADSVETRRHPELFHPDTQTGTPPDTTARHGQNWGFPTYRWGEALCRMQQLRLKRLAQYFDSLRIDHVLGYFRIWEIPAQCVDGVLGHFSPSLPLTVDEIEYFGLHFRRELFTEPFINDRLTERLFGIHAAYVRENCLERQAYNLYKLKAPYRTQRQVAEHFDGRHDENSLWIRDGLMQLCSNVLFVEDPRQPEMYHPRIGAPASAAFEALGSEEKDAYRRLYDNYFHERHSFFWGQQALRLLPAMVGDSRLLLCAEDVGPLPDCVAPVLDELRILTLEIQRLPKQQGYEYAHLEANPVRSVSTIATHDMEPLRLWWQQQPDQRQRYYVTMMQKEGRAPEQLPVTLAEEIIARHLYSPSMLCVLQLQDWLAMDSELRSKHPQQERVNTPSDPYNRWQWRMHLTIEQLLEAERFNHKLKIMIQRSRR